METCCACGAKSLMYEKYGAATLCKVCALKVLTPTWKNKEYQNNREVERQKEKVLRMAEKNGFAPGAIEGLAAYFDSMRIEGLVKKLDGNKGQKLFLCERECILETSGSFDYEAAEKAYRKILSGKRGGRNLDGILNSQIAMGLLGEVVGAALPGGGLIKSQIKRAGRSLAAQSLAGNLLEKKEPDGEAGCLALSIRTGKRTVAYDAYDTIQYAEPVGEESYGFLLLQDSRTPEDPAKDVIFFFGNYTETKTEAGRAYEFIKSRLAVPEEKPEEAEQSPQGNSLADEILMYKRLLDLGAITQEEYDAKKKQLLGL